MSDRSDRFWSTYLGVDATALTAPGVRVVPHAALGDYQGVWLFVRDRSAVVSAPPDWVGSLAARLAGVPLEHLVDPAWASAFFGAAATRVLGPAHQAWLPPSRFRPATSDATVRALTPADRGALEAFRAEHSEAEWEESGVDVARDEGWGAFVDGALASVAQLRRWGPDTVDPCILARLASRGRSYTAHATSAALESALARDDLVLYRTLLTNRPALALAERLGFVPYARLVAVRLARATPA